MKNNITNLKNKINAAGTTPQMKEVLETLHPHNIELFATMIGGDDSDVGGAGNIEDEADKASYGKLRNIARYGIIAATETSSLINAPNDSILRADNTDNEASSATNTCHQLERRIAVLTKQENYNNVRAYRNKAFIDRRHMNTLTVYNRLEAINTFKSSVWIEKDDRKVNAKSLLGVLSLGIAKGMVVTLIADGSDENEAVDGLIELVQTGLAE